MTKKIPKADIDFERDLWKAADELRGAVAENQYKDYVLSLIFIKHLSERYEIRKDELRNDLEDPQSGYYTTDLVEISYVLEDPDEYLSRNILIVPKEASWQYLQDNAEQDDIKVKIDDALDKLQEVLDTYKPGNPDLLPRIFVKSQLTARQVGGLINLFSQKKFSEKIRRIQKPLIFAWQMHLVEGWPRICWRPNHHHDTPTLPWMAMQ